MSLRAFFIAQATYGMERNTVPMYRYRPGQKVFIAAIAKQAVVEVLHVSMAGTRYNIAWWSEDERKEAWVLEAELEPIDETADEK